MQKKILQIISISFATILLIFFVLALAVRPYKSLSAVVPYEVDLFFETNGNDFDFLNYLIGSKAERLKNNGVGFYIKDDEVVLFFKESKTETVKTEDHLGYTLENLLTGEDYWRVRVGGYFAEGNKKALKKYLEDLVNFDERLNDNKDWISLYENLPSGDAGLYFFDTEDEVESFYKATGVSIQKNEKGLHVSALTLMDKDRVEVFNYGNSRKKWERDLIKYVPEDVCYMIGGEDIVEQFAWTNSLLDQYSPTVKKFTESFLFEMKEKGLPIKNLRYDSENEAVFFDSGGIIEGGDGFDYLKNEGYEKDLAEDVWFRGVSDLKKGNQKIINDVGEYFYPATRWGVMIYPKNCESGFMGMDLSGFDKVVLGQQIYNDRILTTLDIE